MRIGPVKNAKPLRKRLSAKRLRPSAYGLILAGSTPLLTLALYIGWQMASPSGELAATSPVLPPLRPANVAATPATNEPRPVYSEDVYKPAEEPIEYAEVSPMPVRRVPYEEPMLPPSQDSFAEDDFRSAAPSDAGRAVRVQSVVPVYSEPPLSHPTVRSRIASRPSRQPIPAINDDAIYRR